ncbi:hypothetical protein [Ornithinimicrobium sp. W1665]|uniref:hypothetical protein n=1 Tax=Ornithinimicrobium sp. W1665 TaxID=3416666 RepID=UPI003D6A4B60
MGAGAVSDPAGMPPGSAAGGAVAGGAVAGAGDGSAARPVPGSVQDPSHPVLGDLTLAPAEEVDPYRVVDLLAEGQRLLAKARESGRGRAVRSVVRQPGQNLIVLGLPAGGGLPDHDAPGLAAVPLGPRRPGVGGPVVDPARGERARHTPRPARRRRRGGQRLRADRVGRLT